MFFLADAPGPAGAFGVSGNKVVNNTRACPAFEDAPPLSGVGIALLGTRGMEIKGNQITHNVPSGPTGLSGGVVVTKGFGGTPPTNNTVVGNTILRNKPDILWDKSGSGNRRHLTTARRASQEAYAKGEIAPPRAKITPERGRGCVPRPFLLPLFTGVRGRFILGR